VTLAPSNTCASGRSGSPSSSGIGFIAPIGAARPRAAVQAWQVLPYRLKRDFLRQGIARIELDETDGTAAVTFAPEARPPRASS